MLATCIGVVAYLVISVIPAEITDIDPAAYQQFNPFYVVALTPFSLAFFSWLGKKGKEPSAPRKIGYGMIMAGIAYCVMVMGSLTLVGTNGSVSPNWLIHYCKDKQQCHDTCFGLFGSEFLLLLGVVSFLIYFFGRRTYAHIIKDKKQTAAINAKAATAATEQQQVLRYMWPAQRRLLHALLLWCSGTR